MQLLGSWSGGLGLTEVTSHKDIYRDRLRLGVGHGRQRPRRALPDLSPGPWHATGIHSRNIAVTSYDTNLTWSCSCNNWIWCFRGRSVLTDKEQIYVSFLTDATVKPSRLHAFTHRSAFARSKCGFGNRMKNTFFIRSVSA